MAIDQYGRTRDEVWKFAECVTANTTITVWTPTTSTRIVITGFDVANSSGATGTMLILFGNLAGQRIALYNLSASTTINPRFGGLNSNTYDRTLNAVSSVVPMQITAYGYEGE